MTVGYLHVHLDIVACQCPQYLKNLTTELGGDLTQLEMDQSAINNVLSMSVVDGKAYTLADLIALDGQKLTTLDGSLASVTVKQ